MAFPVISALKSVNAGAAEQGKVQGALFGARALAQGTGPLLFSALFNFFTRGGRDWPAAPFWGLTLLMAAGVAVALGMHVPGGGSGGGSPCSAPAGADAGWQRLAAADNCAESHDMDRCGSGGSHKAVESGHLSGDLAKEAVHRRGSAALAAQHSSGKGTARQASAPVPQALHAHRGHAQVSASRDRHSIDVNGFAEHTDAGSDANGRALSGHAGAGRAVSWRGPSGELHSA